MDDVLEALDSCRLTEHIYPFGNLNQDRSISLIIGKNYSPMATKDFIKGMA